jgi:hypothetical protein
MSFFKWSGLHKNKRPIKSHVGIRPGTDMQTVSETFSTTANGLL